MDIATATALQNFMSDLQTRKLTGPAEKSTDTSDPAKPKPEFVVLLPSEHQRQAMREPNVILRAVADFVRSQPVAIPGGRGSGTRPGHSRSR